MCPLSASIEIKIFFVHSHLESIGIFSNITGHPCQIVLKIKGKDYSNEKKLHFGHEKVPFIGHLDTMLLVNNK